MQILLSPELAEIVEQQIASGAYSSPEAVIAAALLQFNPDALAVEAEVEAENERRWQRFKQSGHTIDHSVVKNWVTAFLMPTVCAMPTIPLTRSF